MESQTIPQVQVDNWCPSTATNDALLTLAWAVTLRRYTNRDTVSFDVRPSHDKLDNRLHTISIHIDDSKSISDAIQEISQLLRNPCREHVEPRCDKYQTLHNSSVLWIALDNGEESRWGYSCETRGPGKHTLAVDAFSRLSDSKLRMRSLPATDQLPHWQIQRILYHFAHAAQQIHRSPAEALHSLMGLSPQDNALLRGWNTLRPLPGPGEDCIHDLVMLQSQARPDAPAICAWDMNFTYQDLDRCSSDLSFRLSGYGIGPGQTVPLLFERSGWTAVAILAVLKSGASFVLLEPMFPEERLQQMCKDVKSSIALCSQTQAHRLLGLRRMITIPIAQKQQHISKQPDFTCTKVSPWDAAYIAFTSGSTGTPKGVVIDHGAFCTSARAHGDAIHIDAQSRVFHFASYAFDASILEILTTLIRGGCVCVPSELSRRRDIASAISELQANWALLTPSVVRMLDPVHMPSLRTLVLGGEAVSRVDVEKWAHHLRLAFAYGPSECSVVATARSSVLPNSDPTNIGFPTGCTCWVVDAEDPSRLAPIGAIGELVIEGPIAGREYIGRPDASARAFVHHPPWLRPFRRPTHPFYYTGDLVRWQEDGSLQILGRKDDQVKLHGQRLELGEVEHAIRTSFPGCNDAVSCMVTLDGRNAPALVAFICDNEQRSDEAAVQVPTEAFLRSSRSTILDLHQRLPAFMVPTLWLPLSRLPFTTTGKVDRRRLCAWAAGLSPGQIQSYTVLLLDSTRVKPHSEMEANLQGLIARVLGRQVEDIPLDVGFIHLGGDSITAMTMCMHAREIGISLDPLHLMEEDTLESLARSLTNITHTPVAGSVECPSRQWERWLPGHFPDYRPIDIEHVLPATDLQGFCLEVPCEYFQINLQGPLDQHHLKQTCQTLVERHEVLRTLVKRSQGDGRLLQVVLRQSQLSFDVHVCDDNVAEIAQTWIHADGGGQNPHALEYPATSPIHFSLIHSAHGEQHCLIVRIPRTHCDGMSARLLMEELAGLYEGKTLPSPVPFSQYCDPIQVGLTEDAREFWRTTLQDANMTYLGDVSWGEVIMVHRAIPLVRPPSGITLATVVKAAWAMTLAWHLGDDDLLFGQVVTGRSGTVPGAQSIIGPCMNFLPVRAVLRGADQALSALDLLRQLQTQSLQSTIYETTQWEALRELCASWPRTIGNGTGYGSIVLHQNISTGDEIRLGDAHGSWNTVFPVSQTTETLLSSLPVADELHVLLTSTEAVLDADTAGRLVAAVGHFIKHLVSLPDTAIEEMLLTCDELLEPSTHGGLAGELNATEHM